MNRVIRRCLRASALVAIAVITMAPQVAKYDIHIVNLTPYTIRFWLKSATTEWELESLQAQEDQVYGAGQAEDAIMIYIADHGDGIVRQIYTKARWALTWDQEHSLVVVQKIEQ